jgi:hypothetical protein
LLKGMTPTLPVCHSERSEESCVLGSQ